jgi:hypothetical protein
LTRKAVELALAGDAAALRLCLERRSDAIRCRRLWRAETAMGAVIRSALARAGVDAAGATRL